MKNPFLVGKSIYLRSIEETDLTERYRDWFNDAEICRYNSHHRFPNYMENMKNYYDSVISSRENLVLAVCDKTNDLHVGNISLQSIDLIDRSAEFAIIIGDKTYWKKGVGKEAMSLIIAHGFDQLNLHRIYCGTSQDNVGMQTLALSLGFKDEGRSREALFKDGQWKDLLRYGLLKDEFRQV